MKDIKQDTKENTYDIPKDVGSLSAGSTADSVATKEPAEFSLQPRNSNSNNATLLKFSEEQHQYLREYIRNADQKAIFFFAICSGLLAFLNTKNGSLRWLKNPSEWSMLDLDAFVAMVGLAIAAAFFLSVVVPSLKGSIRGLIFFNAIAEYSNSEEYVSDLMRRGEEDLARAKIHHCYEIAKICKAKFTKLAFGLYIGAISLLASLFYLLVTH